MRNEPSFIYFLVSFLPSLIYGQAYNFQLDPWGDDSIRIRIAPPGNPIVDQNVMALLPEAPSMSTLFEYDSLTGGTNGNLKITVDATTGFIRATRLSDNKVLLDTTQLVFSTPSFPVSYKNSFMTTLTFKGHGPTERIYGLGEHRTNKVNQMPYSHNFVDSQLYSQSNGADVSIPWYCSSEGYGFVWNFASFGTVKIDADSITWTSEASRNLDIWITTTSANLSSTTSSYGNLLNHYVDAVGHAPPMPYYSTGFIQCKDRYRNQSQIMDVARGYVSRSLPISVIVIDWEHWIYMGDWTFNAACFPDPQSMVDELKTLGIELMVTFWPFQTTLSQHWDQYTSNGYLWTLNGTIAPYDRANYVIDSTNPQARNATFQNFLNGYLKFGIKNIWLDAAEPETFDSADMGYWQLHAGTQAEVGEAWVQQHVRGFAEGMASVGIGPSDYFVLPRSAWSGTLRYSAALWSGDIDSTFEELALQVKVAQGVAMSGVVLWTTDIGGYNGGDPQDPTFQDLIVRWFQFGAFCPLFRLHGHRSGGPPANDCGSTNGDNEVWNLAKESQHYNGIARVMELRENIRSYVAQINSEASTTGMPMLRPMFLQWPNDPDTQGSDVEDQFMFGPNWLVAPVTTYQATERSVYLPRLSDNSTWIYWWNQTDYGKGGSRISILTPINEFPLFYQRPISPIGLYNATNLFSSEREDACFCLYFQCYQANNNNDGYSTLFIEGTGIVTTTDSITVNGVAYPVVPLMLYYSETHSDNFVALQSIKVPDSTYNVSGSDGYVLAQQAPNSLELQVWFKSYGGLNWDYLTVASDAGLRWAKTNGYTYQFSSGYIFPAGFAGF